MRQTAQKWRARGQIRRSRNLLAAAALFARRSGAKGIQMKTKTSTLQTGASIKVYLAVAATALALLAIPHAGHAQGVFRGAEQGGREGVREGGRAAGPVGAVVGGAIGTGVGAAVGGVRGVLGVDRGRRCRGYYTRRGYFRCYRY
jgi:hypothetical protein